MAGIPPENHGKRVSHLRTMKGERDTHLRTMKGERDTYHGIYQGYPTMVYTQVYTLYIRLPSPVRCVPSSTSRPVNPRVVIGFYTFNPEVKEGRVLPEEKHLSHPENKPCS